MTTPISVYIAGDSPLHRLFPLTKLVLILFIILAGFTLKFVWAGYAVFLGLVFPLSVWGNVWRQMIRDVLKIVLPFAISIFLIQGLFWGAGASLFSIGPITIRLEGVVFAFASVGRIMIIVSSFLLLSYTTRPDVLMISLKQIGLPSSITYIVVTTIQIIPRFQMKVSTIIDAQRSRGLSTEGNLIQRARALPPLVMPLVLGSIVDVEDRAIAIEARAFSSPVKKTSLVEITDRHIERVARWVMLALIFLMIGCRIWWS